MVWPYVKLTLDTAL